MKGRENVTRFVTSRYMHHNVLIPSSAYSSMVRLPAYQEIVVSLLPIQQVLERAKLNIQNFSVYDESDNKAALQKNKESCYTIHGNKVGYQLPKRESTSINATSTITSIALYGKTSSKSSPSSLDWLSILAMSSLRDIVHVRHIDVATAETRAILRK